MTIATISAGGHVGGADTGGEGTQCTIGAGVTVRADDAVACGHDAFFRQQGVLNAHLAHIVEVKDIVFVGELAALLGLGGTLDVLVGHKVVQHDGDVLFVEHTVKTGLFKLVDGNRGAPDTGPTPFWPGKSGLLRRLLHNGSYNFQRPGQ